MDRLSRTMLQTLSRMAWDSQGRLRVSRRCHPHRRTLEALVTRGLVVWAPTVDSSQFQAEITEEGRRILQASRPYEIRPEHVAEPGPAGRVRSKSETRPLFGS